MASSVSYNSCVHMNTLRATLSRESKKKTTIFLRSISPSISQRVCIVATAAHHQHQHSRKSQARASSGLAITIARHITVALPSVRGLRLLLFSGSAATGTRTNRLLQPVLAARGFSTLRWDRMAPKQATLGYVKSAQTTIG